MYMEERIKSVSFVSSSILPCAFFIADLPYNVRRSLNFSSESVSDSDSIFEAICLKEGDSRRSCKDSA